MVTTTAPDPHAEWWTTTDVAAYLGVQVGTVSSYRNRGQMPEPDVTEGRTHKWRPARITGWRDAGAGQIEDQPGGAYIEVSTATETRESAIDLARLAVEARFAAGAQITGPVIATFWHVGEFGTGEEWRLVLRTHDSRFAELRDLLIQNHPWKNPEVIAVHIAEGSDEYLDWIRKTVSQEG